MNASRLTLELVANPGEGPEAVLFSDQTFRQTTSGTRLARRILGEGARFDGELSFAWGRSVWCTAEFSSWWRGRLGLPAHVFSLDILRP